MPREITTHRINGCNEALTVEAHDEPGSGGANHLYLIEGPSFETWLRFQNGPIKEAGINGITHEVLLAVLIDRLEGFQKGPFAHGYNTDALKSLMEARASLNQRTRDRMYRGVEGTHTV
jgi:hypothetical protein